MNKKSCGFALPLTLIVIALLSALSFGLSKMARDEVENIRVRKLQWEDEKLARDLKEKIVYSLLVGSYSPRAVGLNNITIPLNGTPIEMDGALVKVQDGAGLYGFALLGNLKFKSLLEQLTDSATAQKIHAELEDWVDLDDRRRFKGKEKANYLSEGLPQLPRNAPIRNVDELLELPSMTLDVMNGVEGGLGLKDLLLAGGSTNFNLATAPDILIRPVLGVNEDRAARIIAARRTNNWNQVLSLVDPNDWIYDGYSPLTRGYKYRLLITGKSGYQVRGQVELTPYRDDGVYSLVEWQAPEYLYK